MSTTSAAFSTAVSAYALKIIQSKTPSHIIVDASLAPFLVSSLEHTQTRALSRSTEEVSSLGDLDSQLQLDEEEQQQQLLDLLMEQCEMSLNDAKLVLHSVHNALLQGNVHFSEPSTSSVSSMLTSSSTFHRSRSVSFLDQESEEHRRLVHQTFHAPFQHSHHHQVGHTKLRSKSTGNEYDLNVLNLHVDQLQLDHILKDAIPILGQDLWNHPPKVQEEEEEAAAALGLDSCSSALSQQYQENQPPHKEESNLEQLCSSSSSSLSHPLTTQDQDLPSSSLPSFLEQGTFHQTPQKMTFMEHHPFTSSESPTGEMSEYNCLTTANNTTTNTNTSNITKSSSDTMTQDDMGHKPQHAPQDPSYLLHGFSPFLSEEEKKMVHDLKNLEPPTFTFTPMKEDHLIPFDLLGGFDDVSFLSKWKKTDEDDENHVDFHEAEEKEGRQSSGGHEHPIHFLEGNYETSNDNKASLDSTPPNPLSNSNSIRNENATSNGITNGTNYATSKNKKNKGQEAKDLAAALFARPRARSTQQYDEKSPKLKPMAPPPSAQLGMSGLLCCSSDAIMKHSIPVLFQKQLESAVEILMAMNYDAMLCHEAAHEAALISNADVNVAQHVIESALAAPPVCRHLLNDGCYRSDCQFSHDVDGHTCLFWLRGRCRTGDSCKFMHGFSEKLLDGVQLEQYYKKDMNSVGSSSTVHGMGHGIATTSTKTTIGSTSKGKVQTANLVQVNMQNSFANRSPLIKPLESSPMMRPFDITGNDMPPLTLATGVPAVPKSASAPSSAISFASIASKGYSRKSSFSNIAAAGGTNGNSAVSDMIHHSAPVVMDTSTTTALDRIPTVRIPQDMWNPSHNRSASVFHITDPMLRYTEVSKSWTTREDVIDLHFQSIKTFPLILASVLPEKLHHGDVWIITGSGHGVGSKTHQKSGGVLESAVLEWLISNEYSVSRGKDKNGFGGALLIRTKT